MDRSPEMEILSLFRARGQDAYLGEPVSQLEHALQSAHLASQAGASDALVVAALLHDVGHLLHNHGDDSADRGVDAHHEAVGAAWLLDHFGPEVAEPARLHVEAKRYLCWLDSSYLASLSPASKLSLKLQGGPMTWEESRDFEANPFHLGALRLRAWDDQAKVPELEVPGLDHYAERIAKILIPPSRA